MTISSSSATDRGRGKRITAFVAGVLKKHGPALICVALLFCMAANMLTIVMRKSVTHDEAFMIPAGYIALTESKFDTLVEHPPVSRMIAAVPLLFLKLAPWDHSKPDPPAHFWFANKASFELISFWARIPPILWTVALGLLIFVFARELFGSAAAVFAVCLFSLEPTVLAHGRVVQTDMLAALSYLLLIFALYRYLQVQSAGRAIQFGLAGGFACLTKFSMVLAAPIVATTFVVLLWHARADRVRVRAIFGHAGLAALAAILFINAGYFFHSRPILEEEIGNSTVGSIPYIRPALAALSNILPTDFFMGILAQVRHSKHGHTSSLLGMYSETGWPHYFLVASALKLPIPLLLLSIASIGWCGYRAIRWRDSTCILLLGAFALYFVFCSMSRIAIGIRYLLPAFPVLFIMAGGLLARSLRLSWAKAAGGAVAAVLAWTAIESYRAYPDHMSYMNQFAAPKPHWYYLSDSNLEWGDDVRLLAGYLHERGESRVQAALLGGFTLHFYGIELLDLLRPDNAPIAPTRYVALGAGFLNGSSIFQKTVRGRALSDEERVNLFDRFRTRRPEAIIGRSIYVFRADEAM